MGGVRVLLAIRISLAHSSDNNADNHSFSSQAQRCLKRRRIAKDTVGYSWPSILMKSAFWFAVSRASRGAKIPRLPRLEDSRLFESRSCRFCFSCPQLYAITHKRPSSSSSHSTTMRRASYGLRRAIQRRALQTHAAPLKDLSASSVQITTLPNKIRVATESTPGHFSAVGLYIDAGTRYETPNTSGVSHFLDRMAFKVCI